MHFTVAIRFSQIMFFAVVLLLIVSLFLRIEIKQPPAYNGLDTSISVTIMEGKLYIHIPIRMQEGTRVSRLQMGAGVLGFGYTDLIERDFGRNRSEIVYWRIRIVSIPLWSLIVLFGGWPLFELIARTLRTRRLKRRRLTGLCVHCGYNLIGLPDGRCPECGEAKSVVM